MQAAVNTPGIFITGTDTGVGKTIVGSALARFLSEKGLRVGICKPVESGVPNQDEPGQDAELLSWAAGTDDPLDLIAPYRLTSPISPDQAARQDGTRIDFNVIEEAIRKIKENCDFIIVEGAGGLMVPLAGGMLISDLADHLRLPLLVVSRPDLGTINHTLLTTYTARTMGLEMAGVIINRMPEDPNQAQQNAPHAIASLASTSLLATLPAIDGTPREQIEQLALKIAEAQTLPWLLTGIKAPVTI